MPIAAIPTARRVHGASPRTRTLHGSSVKCVLVSLLLLSLVQCAHGYSTEIDGDITPTPASELEPTCTNNGVLIGNGASYRGELRFTVGGRMCQSWDFQFPHIHSMTSANVPLAGLEDGSYCRNPDGDTRPWCYTTDENTVWEYCDICRKLAQDGNNSVNVIY